MFPPCFRNTETCDFILCRGEGGEEGGGKEGERREEVGREGEVERKGRDVYMLEDNPLKAQVLSALSSHLFMRT